MLQCAKFDQNDLSVFNTLFFERMIMYVKYGIFTMQTRTQIIRVASEPCEQRGEFRNIPRPVARFISLQGADSQCSAHAHKHLYLRINMEVSNSIYCLYFEFILQQKWVFHLATSHIPKRSLEINRNNK